MSLRRFWIKVCDYHFLNNLFTHHEEYVEDSEDVFEADVDLSHVCSWKSPKPKVQMSSDCSEVK